MDTRLSAVILTKNEEKNIADCIKSLSWCDEIVIIDDNSSDKTVRIAQDKGVKTYVHSLHNDFSAQRNFGLNKAVNSWVLFLDADERIPLSLQYEIAQLINDPMNTVNGYFIRRTDVIWGKKIKHGEAGRARFLRLGKKGAGEWKGTVHETWNIQGKTTELKNPILHYPHQSVEDFIREVNYYSDLRALELYRKKTHSYWWTILFYPKLKFFRGFILWRGFLDGIPGLIIAIMMSFHSFLTRGKLYLLWKKK